MNGNIRYGIFGTLVSGIIMGEGYNHHGWAAAANIAVSLVIATMAYGSIEKGVKEVVRLHDLEILAKARRTTR